MLSFIAGKLLEYTDVIKKKRVLGVAALGS
jgi:hypothetical protein